jgi:GNAT superfamily N-acetyltransferase
MTAELTIEAAGAERIGELEPLWEALRAHHDLISPDWMPPARDPQSSWVAMRPRFEEWFREEDAFALLAMRDRRAVGLAFVRLHSGSPTWDTGERGGTVAVLAVLAGERRRGVGRCLLAAASERLRTLGAAWVDLQVIEGNDDAARFYAREGFRGHSTLLVRPL